ncbi:hypothetical protein [Nocardia asiatica]|uniref:hypothetical protein n=1 Tax=Nocardia asiatica TaxID=209252 RepID=UPI0024551FC9|nr:hypothetical protein [Nocardia asiatica]
MQITIEGVVTSDALEEGEQRTVELTPYIRGLLRNRLVRQVPFDPPPVEEAPAVTEETPPVVEETETDSEPIDVPDAEPVKTKRTRRPRTTEE